MAEHTLDCPCDREISNHTLHSKLTLVAVLLCLTISLRSTSAQPPADRPTQWKQSIERPSRGWDYDGERIMGHVDYRILVWDATTGKLLHKSRAHRERIAAVQLSPDGKHALSSSWIPEGPMQPDLKSRDTRTILWDLTQGEMVHSFAGQVAGEFSPDGKRIVTFSLRPGEDFRFDAAVWETATGRQLASSKLDKYSNPKDGTLHFTPDGRGFVHFINGDYLLYNRSECVLYDASDGREIGRASAGFGAHRYTSDGALAAFDSEQATLTNLLSGQIVRNVSHDLGTVEAVWSHDGSRLATVKWGETVVQFWDFESGKVTSEAKCEPERKSDAVVSPDNSRLAVEWWDADGLKPGLGLYDMQTGTEVAGIKLSERGHLVGFAPDSKTLLIGGSEFVIYNAEDGEPLRTLKLLDDVSFWDDWNQ